MSVTAADLRRLQRRGAQSFPSDDGTSRGFLISLVTTAELFPPWGTSVATRDRMLRNFVPTEPWLASTVSSIADRNAAFSWTLEGPERTCSRLQEVLHRSQYGKGWVHLQQKVSHDLYTQDNGAFVEIIREAESPSAPLLGLAHLDAARCQRTGNLEVPVVYTNEQGEMHKLKWFQVMDITDAPSSVEEMRGMQMCAVTRVLRIAQILAAASTYKKEKLLGRNPGALHVVSGVKTGELEDALKRAAENSDNQEQTIYQLPAVMGTIDPQAEVKLATIALRSLPEQWSEEEEYKWYIAVLALGFGAEYQDLAPLPGGGLGTSQQSQILHLKARGKGPELYQKIWEHCLNFYVLPQNVTFKFVETDYQAEQIEAEVKRARAETYEKYSIIGMNQKVIWQIMQDNGDLSDEQFQLLSEEEDVTPETTAEDEGRLQERSEIEALVQEPMVEPPSVFADQAMAKALQPGDFWARERTKLERDYEREARKVLTAVRKKVLARIRREVSAGTIPGHL